uniref:CARD domain-containing protein n=1 Tax=Knipowitschia caucasica TaxID=637954 RepID=A0AAV2LPS5_KNICA
MGAKTYNLLRSLIAPAKPADKTIEEITRTLKNHLNPAPLVIAERFRFHKRNQAKTETVSEYIADLRRLAEHCQFGEGLSDALRDRFVCGLHNESTQKRLLTEERLTLRRAVDIVVSVETAARDATELQVAKKSSERVRICGDFKWMESAQLDQHNVNMLAEAQEFVLTRRADIVRALCCSGSSEHLESVLDVLLSREQLTWEDHLNVLVPGRPIHTSTRRLLDLVCCKGAEMCAHLVTALKLVLPESKLEEGISGVSEERAGECMIPTRSLVTQRAKLVLELRDSLGGLLDVLVTTGHFTSADVEAVKLPIKTPSQQVRALLDHVQVKGESAAEVVLQYAQQQRICTTLRNESEPRVPEEVYRYQKKLSSSVLAQSSFVDTYGGRSVMCLDDIYTEGQLELPPDKSETSPGHLSLEDIVGVVGTRNTEADTVLLSGDAGTELNRCQVRETEHLKNPVGLQLDHNYVGDVGVEQLLPCLHMCQSLYLRHNNISDEGICKVIMKGILCENFQKIALFNNNLTDKCMKSFSELLKRKTNFLSLRLGNNNITAEGAKQLAEGLGQNHSLQYLGLWGNTIGDTGARALACALENSKCLVWLSLVGNSVGSAGACALANVIKNCPSLEELWLTDNCITLSGAESLTEALQHNPRMKSVWLRNNHLSEKDKEQLAKQEPRLLF